jgi:glycosyltransferase involved in cell wall biosynthesis
MKSPKVGMPLRVTFLVNRPSWSGGARILARYARLLRDDGCRVSIVSAAKPPLPMRKRLLSILSATPAANGPQSHFDVEGLSVRTAASADRIAPEDIPEGDVVIASFWRAAEWLRAMPPEKGAKIYLVQHHEAEFPHADRARAEATYRPGMNIFVVSRWLGEIMRDRYGRADAVLTPNAIDLSQFSPIPGRRRNANPVIGFLVSSNPTKRMEISIDACRMLRERIPGLRVIALSAAKDRASLPDWMEQRINPPQEKIADVYRACDYWLFTSEIEGYGLPLLEAMACGTPVIASRAGAAPDLIDGENGCMVDRLEAAAFADAAERLFAEPADVWAEMSARAAATARRHGWTESYEIFRRALDGAVKNREHIVSKRTFIPLGPSPQPSADLSPPH